MNIPKENIKRFRKELIFALRDRIKGHWYPDYPERGQGYRAIICEETTDRLLMDAAKKSDIVGEFRQLVKQNTTMWIDPGNVTYRHGKHYEKTLYPFNSINNHYSHHNNNNNNNNGINITNSNNTIPINTSGYHNINNHLNNSNNTIPPQQSQQHINNNNNNSNNNTTNNIILNSLHHHQTQISQQHLNNNNNQNNFSYGITSTRLTQNVVNSNSNGLNGRVSSPSLSSTAPVFSPSNSMYHHVQQQSHSPSISPPASPSKDLGNSSGNNTNVYSSNNNLFYNSNTSSSKIKLAYS